MLTGLLIRAQPHKQIGADLAGPAPCIGLLRIVAWVGVVVVCSAHCFLPKRSIPDQPLFGSGMSSKLGFCQKF